MPNEAATRNGSTAGRRKGPGEGGAADAWSLPGGQDLASFALGVGLAAGPLALLAAWGGESADRSPEPGGEGLASQGQDARVDR